MTWSLDMLASTAPRMNAGWLTVDPQYRRRGYAKKMLGAALAWAHQDPNVALVRATVGPGNVASLATLAAFPFKLVGEQWDEDGGLEQIYEMGFAVQSPS